MGKLFALTLGVAAWSSVAVLAVLIAFNIGERNQIIMFLPILGGVFAAWGIGEAVTESVFSDHGEEM